MTEEKKEKPLFSKDDLDEMFNVSFLRKLQEISKKAKEERMADKDVKSFYVSLILQFDELEEPLSYEGLDNAGKIRMQIQPITQEDIDAAQAQQEAQVENTEKAGV